MFKNYMPPQITQKGKHILIIGIGNEFRGDDAAGLRVAKCLKNKRLENTCIIEHECEGTSLMETWKDADIVILADATCSGAHPGTIHRFDACKQPLPTSVFHYSTHSIGLAVVVELARLLNRLPSHILVYGIEGKSFETGADLSYEVESAVQKVVETIQLDIHNYQRHRLT